MSLLLLLRPRFSEVVEPPPVVEVAPTGGGVADESAIHGRSVFLTSTAGHGYGWGRRAWVRVRSAPPPLAPLRIILPPHRPQAEPAPRRVHAELGSRAGAGGGFGATGGSVTLSSAVVTARGYGHGWGAASALVIENGPEDAVPLLLLGVV